MAIACCIGPTSNSKDNQDIITISGNFTLLPTKNFHQSIHPINVSLPRILVQEFVSDM